MHLTDVTLAFVFSHESVLFTLLILILVARLSVCLPSFRTTKKRVHSGPLKTMVVFGSGGHTTEMIMLLRALDTARSSPALFVIAHSDGTTRAKVETSKLPLSAVSSWHVIHRSREVKQSWISTVFTSLLGALQSVLLVAHSRPDVLICNGPGTCVPLCYALFTLKLLGICGSSSIVFVESFCRVQRSSLTGRLLYPIADKYLVQWPSLLTGLPRAELLGDSTTTNCY